MNNTKKRVLFLCTGNSARSQMAEALTNHYLGERWQAVSAGTHPSGYVHPMAVRALAELGIQHLGESKSTERFRGEIFDLVVTVCDDAAENCPVWLGKGEKTHIGFMDPAKVTGSDEEVLAAFRAVRDQIQEQVLGNLKRKDSLQSPEEHEG